MEKYRNVVVLFGILCIFLQEACSTSLRLIGGHPVITGSAPYHASLRSLANAHVCGGAVISNNAILSAAHCFKDNVLPEYVMAVLGTSKMSEIGDRYNISSIIMHEKYIPESKKNDIAIVTTDRIIIFTRFVKPIALWSKFIAEGQLLVTGYGDITNSGQAPTDLMQINLNILKWETCKTAYANVLKREIFETQICTYNGFNEGTCKGDSGAPLVMNSVLVGIVSFGVPCAVGMPDVFTRTSEYVRWIKEKAPVLMSLRNK